MSNEERENQKNKFYSSKNFGRSFNPNFTPNYKEKNKDSNKDVNLDKDEEKKKSEPVENETKKQSSTEKEKRETQSEPTDTKVEEKEEKKSSKAEENESKEKKQERCVSCEEYLKLKYQLAEMINKYKQLDSEFENYRKRTREEIKDATTKGKTQAIELILPALDSFKKAKRIVKDEKNLEGINLIEKSLMQALEKQGVKKIDCVGKEFDPDYHNAVAIVDDATKKSNTVLEEIEAGYTLGDKVIKFSQVVVNKKNN